MALESRRQLHPIWWWYSSVLIVRMNHPRHFLELIYFPAQLRRGHAIETPTTREKWIFLGLLISRHLNLLVSCVMWIILFATRLAPISRPLSFFVMNVTYSATVRWSYWTRSVLMHVSLHSRQGFCSRPFWRRSGDIEMWHPQKEGI